MHHMLPQMHFSRNRAESASEEMNVSIIKMLPNTVTNYTANLKSATAAELSGKRLSVMIRSRSFISGKQLDFNFRHCLFNVSCSLTSSEYQRNYLNPWFVYGLEMQILMHA